VDTTGLGDRLDHRPSQLSGGQQQRVAVARALIGRPDIVFADEPTGNLDSRSGAQLLDLLRRSVREFGQTVVMVTHDPVAASTPTAPSSWPTAGSSTARTTRPRSGYSTAWQRWEADRCTPQACAPCWRTRYGWR
jgi:ABC-type iron transport system FetAB ATPase subunit